MKTITCVDCGVEAERRSNSQKRCEDCADIRRRVVRRAASRRYMERNREARREAGLKWARDNPEVGRERLRRQRKENPGAARSAEARRRERDKAVDASRSRHRWTPEEDAVVLSWGAGGLRELGAILGRTRGSVMKRKQKLCKAGLID